MDRDGETEMTTLKGIACSNAFSTREGMSGETQGSTKETVKMGGLEEKEA